MDCEQGLLVHSLSNPSTTEAEKGSKCKVSPGYLVNYSLGYIIRPYFKNNKSQHGSAHLQSPEAGDLCEFKVNLIYTMSSRTTRIMSQNIKTKSIQFKH